MGDCSFSPRLCKPRINCHADPANPWGVICSSALFPKPIDLYGFCWAYTDPKIQSPPLVTNPSFILCEDATSACTSTYECYDDLRNPYDTDFVYVDGKPIDKWHVPFCSTDPLIADTDGDLLLDGFEKTYYEELRTGTYGFPAIAGGDGPYEDLPTYTDARGKQWDLDTCVNINDEDSDEDGLLDGEEVLYYGTDPLNPDTDGDNVIPEEMILFDGSTVTRQEIDADFDSMPEADLYSKYGTTKLYDLSDGGEVNGNPWPGYAWGMEGEACEPQSPTRTVPTEIDSDEILDPDGG